MERTVGTPVDADERIADRRGRGDRGCRAEGHTASLAAVVFRGMLGGRFPRGLCYRLGRMTSPRYQILNLLAPAAYPRQDIQTFPARSSPAQPTPALTDLPIYPRIPHRRTHRLPSKPTPSPLHLYLSACRSRLRCLFV